MAEKRSILLIEYNYIYAQMYQKRLPQKSFTLDIVSDGTDAQRLIERKDHEYDVIITNLFSPPPDGLTFFLELTERQSLPDTFVILHELNKSELDTFITENCPDAIRKQMNDVVFINKNETKPQAMMAEITKSLKKDGD